MDKSTRVRAFVVLAIAGTCIWIVLAWLFSWPLYLPILTGAVWLALIYWLFIR